MSGVIVISIITAVTIAKNKLLYNHLYENVHNLNYHCNSHEDDDDSYHQCKKIIFQASLP